MVTRGNRVYPQAEALRELGEHIASQLPDAVEDVRVEHGELMIRVLAPAIRRVMTFLRDDPACDFKQLMDVTGVDYPGREQRFDVVYNLLSLRHNQRIRVKVRVDEETPVPSVTGIYSSAGWFEREVWDMYGVLFADHPDLRRILTDYGFEGHPMRKDFPLTGFVELRYDDEQKRVVYAPVNLSQEFRSWDFLSPWEGGAAHLPGDEKANVEGKTAEGKDARH